MFIKQICLVLLLETCYCAEVSSSLNSTDLTCTSSPAAAYLIVLIELVTLAQERQGLVLDSQSHKSFYFYLRLLFIFKDGVLGSGRGRREGLIIWKSRVLFHNTWKRNKELVT